MTTSNPLAAVIARINATYQQWQRDTTVATMRADWDALFGSAAIDATTTDFSLDTPAGSLPCRWIDAPTITSPAIILYIHGGGFRLGSIDSHLPLMSDIACAAGCRVLGFNYRLLPDHTFPAPLEDSLSVYRWLLDQGYAAAHIMVAGDSAGGGLAAALVQLLKRRTDLSLPQPAGLILLSAWLDMTLAGASYTSRAEHDPVHQKKMLALLASLYTGANTGSGTELTDPLLSPLLGDLRHTPPTLLQVGDCEVGLDDSVDYARRACAAGSMATVSVWPQMIHVFQMFTTDLPEARAAIAEIAGFIRQTVPA